MDEPRFDVIVKRLATGRTSRRRFLRGALGGAGAVSLVLLQGRDAGAAPPQPSSLPDPACCGLMRAKAQRLCREEGRRLASFTCDPKVCEPVVTCADLPR
jgi:hypothetical protein